MSLPVVEQLAAIRKAQPNGWEVCPGCKRESMQYGQCILPGIGCGATKLASMPCAISVDAVLVSGFGAPQLVAPKPAVAATVDASAAKPKKAKRAPARKGARARAGQSTLMGETK